MDLSLGVLVVARVVWTPVDINSVGCWRRPQTLPVLLGGVTCVRSPARGRGGNIKPGVFG